MYGTTLTDPVEALRQSEERFRGMFEHASIGIVMFGPDLRIQRANPTYARMIETTESELIGRDVRELTHPDDVPRHAALAARLMTGEVDHYVIEQRYVLASGRTTWGRVSISAVRDADGEIASLVGMKEDITDQRAATQQLADDHTLRELAGRVGRLGGWSFTLEDDTVYWSDVVCSILAMPRGMKTSPEIAFAFYAPESRAMVQDAFEACVTNGTSFDLEAQLISAAQERRWARVIGQPRYRPDGSIDAIQGAMQDITEQKTLELQFLRSQRLESVGILAGGIAHDLNNVLAPILMSIDLLRMDETDPERLAILAGVESSAQRGADMVRQVLTFARGAEGRRISVQVRHIVREVEKIVRDTFPKNIMLRTDVPGELWPVTGDPTQLHQVMVNLAVNARDAMPCGGTLSVALREVMVTEQEAALESRAKPGAYVVLEVADTGTGIPAQVMERIFDPFFTTKETGKGTGLGLSTSASIVKSHDGFMAVESTVGKGSTFRVFLPADTEAITGPRDAIAPTAKRGLGELILVVDDEPAVRVITKRALERLGYRVLTAGDGAEAISQFAAHRDEVALVITDMMMPVMDGSTLIEMLVRMEHSVRIVAVSGVVSALREVEEQAGRDNVRGFLQKPYSTDILLASIREALD
jgi:PAS domain S-box-containing protein